MQPVPAQLGRFLTRPGTNRVVDIHSSREAVVIEDGREVPKILWTGSLLFPDGSKDSDHDWTSAGQFVNPQNVAHPLDLHAMISAAEAPLSSEQSTPSLSIDQLRAELAGWVKWQDNLIVAISAIDPTLKVRSFEGAIEDIGTLVDSLREENAALRHELELRKQPLRLSDQPAGDCPGFDEIENAAPSMAKAEAK